MLNFPAVKTIVDSRHNVAPSQKVVLEWNYNIHAGITEMGIDDIPLYNFDLETNELKVIETSSQYDRYREEIYPLTSIASFIRPGEIAVNSGTYVGGIVKAVFGSNSSRANYNYTNQVRNYFVSKDDGYKYWAFLRTRQPTTAINKSVYIKYDRAFKSNKIVLKFETAQSRPTNMLVYVLKSGTWTLAYTYNSPSGLTTGGLALYYNGTSWTTTKHANPSLTQNVETFSGIKVLINNVNVGYSPVEIIEISPRLEANVSADVVSWEVEKTLFEDGGVLPVGEISSNSATVEFDNTFNDFSYEKVDSKYYGILDKRVGVKIFSIIENNEIPQFTGYVEDWSIQPNTSASISCYDMAKVLQQTPAPDMVIGPNYTIGKVIRTIFDSVGLNEITIDVQNSVNDTVGFFWMMQEKTVWEVLQELCISHQATVFFDEYGRAVFKSRGSVLDPDTTDQVLTYSGTGGILPNIVDFNQSAKPRIGNLTVKYARKSYENQNDVKTTYEIAQNSTKKVPLVLFRGATYATTIWEPDTEWKLFAFPLSYNIPMGNADINVPVPTLQQVIQKNQEVTYDIQTGLSVLSGYFYINGEIIYFDGTKFLVQYNDGRGSEEVVISNNEEYQSLINSDPGIRLITHSGKITGIKRGQFGTQEKAHTMSSPDNGAWSIKQTKIGTTTVNSLQAPTFSINNTALRLSTDNSTGSSTIKDAKASERRSHIKMALITPKKDNYKRFETTMRIVQKEPKEDVADVDSIGGIVFDYNEATNSGYFIELGLETTTLAYKKADSKKSVYIYKLKNGAREILASLDGPDVKVKRDTENTIFRDSISFETVQNYDIQVLRVVRNGRAFIDLYIMGQLIVQVEDTSPLSRTGTKCGVFVRGDSTAFFTKFAAWGANKESTVQDGSFFADSIRGFTTEVIASAYLGGTNKVNIETDFDYYEFYPHIREIRIEEFDFLKYPATPVKIAAGAAISQYGATILSSNSFRAKIAVVNESNFPVSMASSLPGTPTANYPKLIGYALKEFESKEYKTSISIAKADDARFELDSEWVQSYDQAKSIAEFIKSKSFTVKGGKTNDVINAEVEIFANPLIQLGDTVDVEHPDLGLSSGTHSFIVTGINQSFNEGLTTTLRLQEVS